MNEFIYKRKSIRKYDPSELDAATLDQIQAKIKGVTPLYPNIRYSIGIVRKIIIPMRINAPHYILFGSEDKDGGDENIGFIGQQLSLYFTELGLGSCWLGRGKPSEREDSSLPFVICMAFGKPAEPLFRERSEFKRKPLAEIGEGRDNRLEAARLAPSGLNAQNWYFIAENGRIHCYLKKPNILAGIVLNRMIRIDMGIAICHIAAESERRPNEEAAYISARLNDDKFAR